MTLPPRIPQLVVFLALAAAVSVYGAGTEEPFTIASGTSPRLVATDDGGFVVSWLTDSEPQVVKGQRFKEDLGGPAYSISQFVQEESVRSSDLEVLDHGRLLSLWITDDGVGGPLTERAPREPLPSGRRRRLLTLDGLPLSNEETTRSAHAAALGNGTYALLEKRGFDDIGYGQIYDSLDQPVTEWFRFSGGPTRGQCCFFTLDVHAAADGGVRVLWQQPSDPDTTQLFSQTFDNEGKPLAEEQLVAQGHVHSARMGALAAGPLVVTWGQDLSVVSQALDTLGAPMGEPQLVSDPGVVAYEPAIAGSEGLFLIVWTQAVPERGAQTEVWGRRLNAAGRALGRAFRISDSAASSHKPQVTGLPENRFVVAWTEPDDSERRVVGRFVEGALFLDGFESGDASAWSVTVP